jgi:hypothetical protein
MLAIRDDEEAQLNFINEEQDRTDAERALASGDLSKAALHIGRALVKNTKRSDLVDRLILAMKNHKSDILVARSYRICASSVRHRFADHLHFLLPSSKSAFPSLCSPELHLRSFEQISRSDGPPASRLL